MNYYPHHIGDYASATAHLSPLEDCFYRRLLDWYYLDERLIPLDARTVYRRVRAATDADREAVDIVLAEFFSKTDEGYRHARCDAEIERSHIKSEARRDAANKKWGKAETLQPLQPVREEQAIASEEQAIAENGEAKAMHSQEPITNNQEPIAKEEKNRAGNEIPPGFVAFWQAYPNTGRKVEKANCLTVWRKDKLEDRSNEILDHLMAIRETNQWKTGYEPAPLRYLRNKRYEDPVAREGPVNEARAYLEATLTGGGDGSRSQEIAGNDADALRRRVPAQVARLYPARNG